MSVLFFVLGVLAAAIGGDRFVRGAVGLASWWRIPAGIIGATIAAFATSSPELSVGVLAALDGRSELAFGDATGSNMVNLGVVLGTALLAGGVVATWAEVRREVLGFVAAMVILAASAVDGIIGRAEAGGITVIFAVWLAWVVRDARRQRGDVGISVDGGKRTVVFDLVVGIIALVLAGRLIVVAAKDIGDHLGWSPFVVGSVIVALGTSTPELVTTLIALRRGHVGIGVGTVLGSNIFNSLLIVGVAALIAPVESDPAPVMTAIIGATIAVMLVIPMRGRSMTRVTGAGLLAVYVACLAALLGA